MDKKYIIKRNGTIEEFNPDKIYQALLKANINTEKPYSKKEIRNLSLSFSTMVTDDLDNNKKDSIEMKRLESLLHKHLINHKDLIKSYSGYNQMREQSRLMNTRVFQSIGKIAEETDRDNANVGNNFSSKLLRIASESNKYYNLANINKVTAREHEIGGLYSHDLDSYNLTINCLHIDAGKLLANTFNTGYGTLNTPKRISSAASLACIMLQSSQNDMYGGQSIPNFDTDLAPYLRKSLMEQCQMHAEYLGDDTLATEFYDAIREIGYKETDNKDLNNIIKRTLGELKQAMSGVVYNLNTMHSRAGSQVPFSSINLGLCNDIESALICEYFLLEYEKGLGKGEQPIFPNIIYRVKSGLNRNPGDKYYELYQLACRVAAKRMNPTFMNMDSSFNLPWYEKGIYPATMGCRTYIMNNINGESKAEGRGNAASVTINFPRLAIKTVRTNNFKSEEEKINFFMEELDGAIYKAKDFLRERYDTLKKLKVKDLPFSAGEKLLMGSEDLDKYDSIEEIIKHSSWAIGFIGLAETLELLTGKHHGESDEAQELGLRIVKRLRELTDLFTKQYKLNFSCYATPAEGLSGYFIDKDNKIYGDIKGITDKGYYTNSFHVPVGFKIPFYKKIELEAPYHALCNGGHISYIEVDGTPSGEVVERIITNAYKTSDISYIGVNFHIKYCKDCGYYLQNEKSMVCPKCKSINIQGVSRITGYLGLDERFGVGKSSERKTRTSHMDNNGTPTEESLGKYVYNV